MIAHRNGARPTRVVAKSWRKTTSLLNAHRPKQTSRSALRAEGHRAFRSLSAELNKVVRALVEIDQRSNLLGPRNQRPTRHLDRRAAIFFIVMSTRLHGGCTCP